MAKATVKGEGMTELTLDTKGRCLLCLGKADSGSGSLRRYKSKESVKVPTSGSLRSLTRYLRLENVKINQELKGSLCPECSPINARFSEVYQQLEKIEAEVVSCLNLILERLGKAEVKATEDQPQLASKAGADLEILEAIRKEAMDKCSQKLAALLPPEAAPYHDDVDEKAKTAILPLQILIETAADADPASSSLEGSAPQAPVVLRKATKKFKKPNPPNKKQARRSTTTKTKTDLVDPIEGKLMYEPPNEIYSSDPLEASGQPQSTKDPKTGHHKCTLCAKSFTSKWNFKDHYKSIHLKVRYQCPDCIKEFQYRHSYYKHQRNFHIGLKFQCNRCDKVFSDSSGFQKHQQMISCVPGESPRHVVSCRLCRGGFTGLPEFRIHYNAVHLDLRGYACDQCELKFKRPQHLKQHRNSIHLGIKRKR